MSSIKWHTEYERLLTDVIDEYPLTVEIYGKKYKAKYVKYQYRNLYGILVYGNAENIIFISKDEDDGLHDAHIFFGCNTLKDATKEEASNDFIESLLVKEG